MENFYCYGKASLNKQQPQVVGQLFVQTKKEVLMDSCLSKPKPFIGGCAGIRLQSLFCLKAIVSLSLL